MKLEKKRVNNTTHSPYINERTTSELPCSSYPYFMLRIFTWSFLLVLFPILLWGQTGCPDCVIDLPEGLPMDTIFIQPMPNGNLGSEYDENISFRLPISTNPVAALDSTILPGLPLEQISITSIANLPVGLSWETDQDTYALPDTTDGCVRFCGIPQQRGLFLVRVTLTAQVFVVTQSLTFNMPLFIGGAVSMTDGFSMENNQGCGATTVDFFNNLPSQANGDYEYFWDFGNGVTSTEETPPSQDYENPGIYPIYYQAVIDTIGYVFNALTITENESCDDLIGNPDLFVTITTAAGEEIARTEAFEEANLPLAIQLFTPLEEEETYTLTVTDRDRLLEGADDICGNFEFTVHDTLIAEGGMRIELSIMNNPDTISSVDSVYVFAFPDAPAILISPSEEVCADETINLKTTTYTENLQWYQDTLPLLDETTPSLRVSETGKYRVSYTTQQGCTSFSDFQTAIIKPLPPLPVFTNTDNLLQLSDPLILNSNHNLQWYLDGQAIATQLSWCAERSGNYTLEIVDASTDCSNSFSADIVYDASVINCNRTSVQELLVEHLAVYPNPVSNLLFVDLEMSVFEDVEVRLFDIFGKLHEAQIATSNMQFDMTNLASGMYYLELCSGNAVLTWKVMKR